VPTTGAPRIAPVPELKGAGVAAVVVPSAPVGRLFAVPELRLLGASVELPAGAVPEEDVLPVAEPALALLLGELDVLALAVAAGPVVAGIGIERVVFVVVVPDEVDAWVDPLVPVVTVLPLVGVALATATLCAAAAPANASATASARARD